MSGAGGIQSTENPEPVAPEAPTGINNILRLALNGAAARGAGPDRPKPLTPDFGAAVELLNKASKTMDGLRQRCQELEAKLKADSEQFAGELRAAQAHAQECEENAHALKEQVSACEARISEVQGQAEAASQRAQQAEARAAAAERSASEAAEQARLYHEKIMAAFGSRT